MSALPSGWCPATLGEVCQRIEKRDPRTDPDAVFRYIDIGSITEHQIGEVREVTGRDAPSRARQIVRAGDTVLSTVRTYLRKTALVPAKLDPAVASTGFCVLRPRVGIDPSFIFYRVIEHGFVEELSRLQTGSSYPAVREIDVLSRPIDLPPPAEQRRIVAAIEEQFSRIDAAELSLRHAHAKVSQLRRASFANAFERSWPSARIGEVAQVYVGSTPSRARSSYWGGDVPWVSSGEVAFNRIERTRESVTREALGNASRRLHPPGTVLLAMIGEGRTRGQAAILDTQAAHNQNSAAIRLDARRVQPEFLFYWLMYRYEATRRLGSGNNQPALNKARVQAMSLPVPPLQDQEWAVQVLEAEVSRLEALRRHVEVVIRRAAGLRRSVLDRAFSGDLVPQDPTDEPAAAIGTRIAQRAPQPTPRRRRAKA